jgi:hypothetical protein
MQIKTDSYVLEIVHSDVLYIVEFARFRGRK